MQWRDIATRNQRATLTSEVNRYPRLRTVLMRSLLVTAYSFRRIRLTDMSIDGADHSAYRTSFAPEMK